MEGKVMSMLRRRLILALAFLLGIVFTAAGRAQEQSAAPQQEEAARLRLRKTLKTREYGGRAVEGDEKVIQPGDSLWRILIQEKGLPEKRFDRYLIVIKFLNPHIRKLDLLEIGDTLFIPIRPDEILGIKVASKEGEARIYKVKRGDYLYRILRRQFGLRDLRKIRVTFERVKGMNPRKKNWDLLFVGERILIPGTAEAPTVVIANKQEEIKVGPILEKKEIEKKEIVQVVKEEPKPVPQEIIGLDYGRKISAQDNLDLLEKVMGALGNETRRRGEEVLALRDGTVRLDLDSYPIIHNPKGLQRVILDLGGKIPASLRTQLQEERSAAPVVTVKKGASLHEAVESLLSPLGFEALPSNRPVVLQDKGIEIQVMGEWMATASGATDEGTEIFIINLTDLPGKTPDYLRDYISSKGMKLKEILIPPSPLASTPSAAEKEPQEGEKPIEIWPDDKGALVDAFLKSYEISSLNGEILSVEFGEGIRLETRMDRLFEFNGKKFGIAFKPLGGEVKKALQTKMGIQIIELDFGALTSREVISRLLTVFERPVAYREHRFSAVEGKVRDKLVLAVSGFFLPNRSLLLTDREVPNELERFFSEKAIRVVHFK